VLVGEMMTRSLLALLELFPPIAVLIHTCKRELQFDSLSVSLEA
jgi:hypothetical protein